MAHGNPAEMEAARIAGLAGAGMGMAAGTAGPIRVYACDGSQQSPPRKRAGPLFSGRWRPASPLALPVLWAACGGAAGSCRLGPRGVCFLEPCSREAGKWRVIGMKTCCSVWYTTRVNWTGPPPF